MTTIARRSALALVPIIAVPFLGRPRPATAASMYSPDVGKEAVKGVRQVDLGKFPIGIGNYKTAVVTDYVFLAGSGFPDDVMKNDMVCQMLEGAVRVKQSGNPGRPDSEFVAKTGHVFTCAINSHESDTNEGSEMAVMRVIDLMTT
jgi:hypothetical protein